MIFKIAKDMQKVLTAMDSMGFNGWKNVWFDPAEIGAKTNVTDVEATLGRLEAEGYVDSTVFDSRELEDYRCYALSEKGQRVCRAIREVERKRLERQKAIDNG